MLHNLNPYEILEIHELIDFKTVSLVQSKLFLETVKGNFRVGLLETDIILGTQEITDLQNLLLHSNN